MKRFEKCKRVLATLLVALMVLQQTSIMTLAEELQVETQAVQEEKAVEQEAKPETSAPETIKQTEAPTEAPKPTEAPTEAPKPTEAPTEAPATETQAPETQATEAPATEAPVTEAPATEAPVTEAPATEPQVTEAPATEPQVTEAPATEPQITEAPETETTEAVTETESESESETETKAATKDSFSGAVDNATAKVTLSKGISEKAVFVAKQYGLDSDYVAQNVDAALGAWIEAHNLTVLDAAVYDMHFEEDGKEITVKQNAKVDLTFNSPILTETGDTGVATDVYVLHVVNGKAKEVGTVTRNGSDAVTAATIHTDGFSPFVFVKAVSGDAAVSADTSSDLNSFVTNATFENATYDTDGKTLVLHPDSEYSFKLEFAENSDKALFAKDGELVYTYPSQLTPTGTDGTFKMTITVENKVYELLDNTYTIEGNKIKVRFNTKGGEAYEALKIASNAEFWLSLKAKVNSNASGNKINFGASVEKDVKFDHSASVSVEKNGTYDKEHGKMNYTVKVKATGTCTKVKVTDTISGTLLTYDKNLTATSNMTGALTIDSNATAKGNGFEYTIPSMTN